MGRVRDGSTGKIENGYKILEIAALTKENKMPISVYSRVFSPEEDNYINENKITFTYYRIAQGIKNTLAKTTTGIKYLLPKVKYVKNQQLSMFKRSNIEKYTPLASCFWGNLK